MQVIEVCGVQVEGQSKSERNLVVRSNVIHGEAMESKHGHMKQAPLMPLYELKSTEHVCSLCFWGWSYGCDPRRRGSPIKIQFFYVTFLPTTLWIIDIWKLTRGPHWVRMRAACGPWATSCPSLSYTHKTILINKWLKVFDFWTSVDGLSRLQPADFLAETMLLGHWIELNWIESLHIQYSSAALSSSEVSSPWTCRHERTLAMNLFTHAVILSTVLNQLFFSKSNSGLAGSVLVSCTATWNLYLSSAFTSSAKQPSFMLSASEVDNSEGGPFHHSWLWMR